MMTESSLDQHTHDYRCVLLSASGSTPGLLWMCRDHKLRHRWPAGTVQHAQAARLSDTITRRQATRTRL